MIGIIGAMEMEIEGLKKRMSITKEEEICGLKYYVGTLEGKDVVVVKCSPGKVNAALCAQTIILRYEPKLIINPGVAGGIGDNVYIGDLVVGTACVQYDCDTTALGEPKGNLSTNKGELVHLPCHKEYSELFSETAAEVYEGKVHRGIVATGDQFVADPVKCLELKRDFEAMACEMEGGSIAQACFLADIPFVALRSISDNANMEGKVDFMSFARQSAKKAEDLLVKALPLVKL